MSRCIIITVCLVVTLVACEKQSTGQVDIPESGDSPEELQQRTQDANAVNVVIVPPADKVEIATDDLTQIDMGQPNILNSAENILVVNDAPAEGFPLGETLVTWQAIDDSGQVATAVQKIVVTSQIACATEEIYFQQRVSPVLQANCLECHALTGVESNFNLVNETAVDALAINFSAFKKNALPADNSGLSLMLSKAANVNNDHGGAQITAPDSREYITLQNMVSRLSGCPKHTNNVDSVILLTPEEQLRKTTLALSDRLPTNSELALIQSAASVEQARAHIRELSRSMMNETGFALRLKEIFNDKLLTDAFKPKALALRLALDDFDNKDYFGVTELMQQGFDTEASNQLQKYASDGLSQAPLELIVYVVQNDLPFSEVLTANYQMVNPYSATIFSAVVANDANFNYYYFEDIKAHDPTKFLPARLQNNKGRQIPHAGILTTQVFLKRYPSSNTNLNRKRASTIFNVFLDTDVEGLANRANLNLQNIIGLYPTLEDPQCKTCHDVIDPVAGLFKNWNGKGRFLGNNKNWLDKRTPPRILTPGYSESIPDLLPSQDSGQSLQWLATRIVSDNRFITAMVKIMFNAIVGFDLAKDPSTLQRLKSSFIASGLNMKTLVQDVITDTYFIAKNANPTVATTEYYSLGTAKLISPERLQRKISSLFTGYEWISPSKRKLTSQDSYQLLYGGIDSTQIITRTEDPTYFIVSIQERLANQIACEYVPMDFNRPVNTRVLFPLTDITITGDSLVEIDVIKRNIQFLYEYLLGERLSLLSEEITLAFDLFQASFAFRDPRGVSQDCAGSLALTDPIMLDATGAIQAWMAVVNFMLRDYRFLYE